MRWIDRVYGDSQSSWEARRCADAAVFHGILDRCRSHLFLNWLESSVLRQNPLASVG